VRSGYVRLGQEGLVGLRMGQVGLGVIRRCHIIWCVTFTITLVSGQVSKGQEGMGPMWPGVRCDQVRLG
jgi:hypothetical protein